jgi:hypothetical protein
MVRRTGAERAPVDVVLPDGDELWDPHSAADLDLLLDDEDSLDQVTAVVARYHPLSTRRGRLGRPAAVTLRMLILEHVHDWSLDERERGGSGSFVYRALHRMDGARVSDAKT